MSCLPSYSVASWKLARRSPGEGGLVVERWTSFVHRQHQPCQDIRAGGFALGQDAIRGLPDIFRRITRQGRDQLLHGFIHAAIGGQVEKSVGEDVFAAGGGKDFIEKRRLLGACRRPRPTRCLVMIRR
jgi:hypothetical protein